MLIITGPKGAGKSTHLLRLAEALKQRGKTLGGVISRGFWKDGERAGYDIVNPETGVSRRLCARTAPDGGDPGDIMEFCSYYFLRSAFAEGNRWIADGAAAGDIVFIDEIGNIELSGGGWNVLPALSGRASAVLSVREEAVPRLEEVWGIRRPVIRIPPGADNLDFLLCFFL